MLCKKKLVKSNSNNNFDKKPNLSFNLTINNNSNKFGEDSKSSVLDFSFQSHHHNSCKDNSSAESKFIDNLKLFMTKGIEKLNNKPEVINRLGKEILVELTKLGFEVPTVKLLHENKQLRNNNKLLETKIEQIDLKFEKLSIENIKML